MILNLVSKRLLAFLVAVSLVVSLLFSSDTVGAASSADGADLIGFDNLTSPTPLVPGLGNLTIPYPASQTGPVGSQQWDLDFRQLFGLSTTQAALANAVADPATVVHPSINFGLPLSQDEETDLEQRIEIQQHSGDLQSMVNSLGGVTDGVYIDQQANGQFVVLAAPSITASQESEIEAEVPQGGSIRFSQVEASSNQVSMAIKGLDSVISTAGSSASSSPKIALAKSMIQSVSPDFETFAQSLNTDGISLAGFGPNAATGTLELSITGLSVGTEQSIVSLWTSAGLTSVLPASMLSFVGPISASAVDSRHDQPGPKMAGVELDYPGHFCTSNIDGVNQTGVYMITAGHCDTGACATGSGISHSGASLGTIAFSQDCDAHGQTTDDDAEEVKLSPPGYAEPYIYSQTPNGVPTAYTVSGATNPIVGEAVCLNGVSTYFSNCGTVTETNWTVTQSTDYGTVVITGQDVMSVTPIPGDSGAPISSGTEMFGVLSSSLNGGGGSFTPIETTLSNFGLTPLFTQGGPETSSLQVSRFSGNCLDVQNDATANGTPVWSYPCNGNPAQLWSLVPEFTSVNGYFIYSIQRLDAPGECLDSNIAVDNGGLGNGTPLQEWQCNGQDNQQWRLLDEGSGYYEIISVHSNNCLDLNIAWPGGGYTAGTPLQTWQCLGSGQTNQHWRVG